MKTVRNILDNKGYDVWRIGPEDTVFDALRLMADKEVGALVVMDDTRVAGIISERDYARKVVLLGRTSPNTLVKEIMTSHVAITHLEQPIEECMAIMTDKRIRHLPVMTGKELVGIISIGDLVKSIIADQKFMIEQLERYITG
ncbi:MAG TPA: CBS domain-containing protein [Candidatus Binatia bacterium]|nr:CBS domain-containing protein [Candidatus Binatia bacterium]